MTKSQKQPPFFWIFGIHPVSETLKASPASARELVYAREDDRIQGLLQLASRHHVPIRRKGRKILDQLIGNDHHQGIALKVDRYIYSSLDVSLKSGVSCLDPLVMLDSVQDPQNLGAILRSACFFGAKGVIITKNRCAQVTAAVIRVASGATAYLPVYQVVNLVRTMKLLKTAGLWLFGLDPTADRSIYDTDLQVPLGIIVGNEQKGMRTLVREHCDALITIPGIGSLQSLNAAAAAAIVLAEVRRQRRATSER